MKFKCKDKIKYYKLKIVKLEQENRKLKVIAKEKEYGIIIGYIKLHHRIKFILSFMYHFMKETIIKVLKVVFVYILPSVIIAVLYSAEFQQLLLSKPALVAYVPIINVALVALLNELKEHLPEDSRVKKIL